MPALRLALASGGFGDVTTYLQSGNVVLSSARSELEVAALCRETLRERLGVDVGVIVRDGRGLAAVVEADPLGHLGAGNPQRYLVAFFAEEPPAGLEDRLRRAAIAPEQFVISGREVYAWVSPEVERSRLWPLLLGRDLGGVATARNWTTVLALNSLLGA